MNEFLQELASASVPVLCLLITAAGGYLVALIRKKTAQIQQQIDSAAADKYIGMASDAVAQAVASVAQTFVDELKKDDEFTPEDQEFAFRQAKEAALDIMGEAAVSALREIYGDLDAWLDTKIELECRALKSAK